MFIYHYKCAIADGLLDAALDDVFNFNRRKVGADVNITGSE